MGVRPVLGSTVLASHLLLSAMALALLGCDEEDQADGLPVPSLDAEFALAGVAPVGQSADPRLIERLRISETERFVPEGLPGTLIDAFIGGLEASDLPVGVDVQSLELVGPNADSSRALMPLRRVHILSRPSASDDLAGLVPVESPTLNPTEAEIRRDRLIGLTDRIFVRPPCLGAAADIGVETPRTPAEAFTASQTESDGTVRLGLVASGTAAIAVFAPGSRQPRLETIQLPADLTVGRSRIAIRDIGPTRPSERRPAYVVVGVSDGFSEAGYLLRWSEQQSRYEDDTPIVATDIVRTLRGVRSVAIEGSPHECAFGTVQGVPRDAGLWCRTQTSTVWRLELRVPGAQAMTGVFSTATGLLASDRAGSVHIRQNGRWQTLSEAGVNANCENPCVGFEVGLSDQARARAVIAGAEAQLFVLDLFNPGRRETVVALADRSFVDERPEGSRALSLVSATEAPDGRWWIGTARGVLFRGSSDLGELERVCLPVEARDLPISTVAAASDGRLVFGLGNGLVAFGRWDR